ncbi:MAG: hypothetical protein ACRCUU_06485 [Plesiomonas sp.]
MTGEDHCFVLNMDTYRTVSAFDPDLARVIIDNRQMWTVYLFVLCIDNFGKHYIKCDTLTISESLTHTELQPYLNDAHAVLCSECNPVHMVRPAWLAYAGKRTIDIEAEKPRLLELFEQRDGFKRVE